MPPPFGRRPVVETIENDASHHGHQYSVCPICASPVPHLYATIFYARPVKIHPQQRQRVNMSAELRAGECADKPDSVEEAKDLHLEKNDNKCRVTLV